MFKNKQTYSGGTRNGAAWIERARDGGDALQIGQYQGKWLNKRDNHRGYLLFCGCCGCCYCFRRWDLWLRRGHRNKQAYNFRNGQVGVHCSKLCVYRDSWIAWTIQFLEYLLFLFRPLLVCILDGTAVQSMKWNIQCCEHFIESGLLIKTPLQLHSSKWLEWRRKWGTKRRQTNSRRASVYFYSYFHFWFSWVYK